jgi:Flp pilus assembly protein TadG
VAGQPNCYDPGDDTVRHLQRGSSMVEFAISATALMLVMFGILEFGRVMYTYHTVSNAARLGARWAIVRGSSCSVLDHCNATSSDIQTWVQSQVPLVDSGTLGVAATWSTSTDPSTDCSVSDPTGNNTQGHLVCVTVTYPFNFAIPFVSQSALTLSSTSKMVISN